MMNIKNSINNANKNEDHRTRVDALMGKRLEAAEENWK
jgi:hypothetical protein